MIGIIVQNCVRPIKKKFETQFLFRKHRNTEITDCFRMCRIDNPLGRHLVVYTTTRTQTSTPSYPRTLNDLL